MAKIEYNIVELNPDNLSNLDSISQDDANLLEPVELVNTFITEDNFIELNYFSTSGERLSTIENYINYSVLTGDTINGKKGTKEISIDVLEDFKQYNAPTSEAIALYNFLDYSYSETNTSEDFYIESISPDRTEIRIVSVDLPAEVVDKYTQDLIEKRDSTPYALELFLYEGRNTFYSIINIDIEPFRNTFGVLIKLLNPLPENIALKSRLNVVEKVSEPVAYRIETTVTEVEIAPPSLRGPNFDIQVEVESTEPSQYFNYNELFSFPTNNTNRQLNSLFNEKGAELSIDYTDYSNFVNFSSAEERVLNFKYKLDLIESYQTSLDNINNSSGIGVSGSVLYFENLINGVVDNLDHYERHLYYKSGSSSWPKTNDLVPYINQTSSTPEATTWFTNQKETAILYDAKNPDILTNTVPAYLKEDPANKPYNLFIDLIAQHFDNIWIYTDAVSKKYDADNRLDYGASKDLVEDLLKNFGVKLYTSNRSTEDLYRYFTLNSYDIGEEILPEGIISGSNFTPVSQQDYHREINKRLYHNLPLLLKSKGTERGLRALINCFGIPSDILKIKVYGGQSVKDLPFFGGEQPFTSSLDKVRINNTGSIVEGDTLSYYTSISRTSNDLTQDLHRIEVGFSPADNIDDYIITQSALLFPNITFNIDNYIGDPRDISTNAYPDLNAYRDVVLSELDRYEVEDFIRLIKFFDNSIFRMVKDFIPARVVADTGVIIKQHLLERNKAISPILSWTQPEYSSSIQTSFITGSNARAFDSVGAGSVNGQSRTFYNYYVTTPEGRTLKQDQLHEESRFDGEFSGSYIRVSNGELNEDNTFKSIKYDTIIYSASFFEFLPESACDLPIEDQNREVYNAATTNLDTYPLTNLFGAPNGVYTYEVDSINIPSPFEYDFTPGPPYQQYQVFEVSASGAEYGPECISNREVQVVYCNMAKTPPRNTDSAPVSLSPQDTNENITLWWENTNANNFPNHTTNAIRYDIYNNGTLISDGITPAAASSYDFSSFSPSSVEVRIYEPNMPGADNSYGSGGPTACFLEFQIPFILCTLQHTGKKIGQTEYNILTSNPTDTSYIEPFSFTGIDGTTQYFARLTWDPGSNTGDSAQIQSDWEEITNTTAVASGVKSIPTGDLNTVVDNLLGGIQNLNNIDVNNSIYAYSTFTALVSNTTITSTDIRIQVKATSVSGTCEELTSSPFLQTNVTPSPTNTILLYYNNSEPSACCTSFSIQVYSTSTQADFADLSDPAPNKIYSDSNLTTPAISGWYKSAVAWPDTEDGTARYWNSTTESWGVTTIICSTVNATC